MVYVGRGAGCFLRIDDPAVSRVHLSLEVSRVVTVTDLGSRNGTLVNGETLSGSRSLADGDVVELGSRSLRVHIEAADPECLDEETPAIRSGTLGGVGASYSGTASVRVEQRCPRCGVEVPLAAAGCPRCETTWRKARPGSATESLADVGQARPDAPAPRAERRAEPRYALEAVAAQYSGRHVLLCSARDISCGGVFLACSACDPPQTDCEVMLSPPGMDPTLFTGRVIRVIDAELGGPGMAIKFDPLQGSQIRWLAQLLLGRMGEGEA